MQRRRSQMFDSLFPGILVHAGAMFYLICFAFRNQILLRSFAIIGDLFYTAYYFSASDKPLWEAIIWNIPNIALNMVMIVLIKPRFFVPRIIIMILIQNLQLSI